MSHAVVKLENVVKTYFMGDNQVQALRGISFEIQEGEFTAIMGPSGSGKSTCMNMIGCLDRPSSGIVKVDGKETALMSEKELAQLRNITIGFVFQQSFRVFVATVACIGNDCALATHARATSQHSTPIIRCISRRQCLTRNQ